MRAEQPDVVRDPAAVVGSQPVLGRRELPAGRGDNGAGGEDVSPPGGTFSGRHAGLREGKGRTQAAG